MSMTELLDKFGDDWLGQKKAANRDDNKEEKEAFKKAFKESKEGEDEKKEETAGEKEPLKDVASGDAAKTVAEEAAKTEGGDATKPNDDIPKKKHHGHHHKHRYCVFLGVFLFSKTLTTVVRTNPGAADAERAPAVGPQMVRCAHWPDNSKAGINVGHHPGQAPEKLTWQ